MKILFLTQYSSLGASSRYRIYQYLDYLEHKGIKTEVSPLLTEDYLKNIYKGKRISRLFILKKFAERLLIILGARKYDLVVIQKELFPYVPPFFELLLKKINKNIIIDYDDAIFVKYEDNPFLRKKIPTILRLAKAITVGNQYLANYASKFNDNIKIIPTVIDLKKYYPKKNYSINTKRIIIGWIGTPITQKYLYLVEEPLKMLASKYVFVLRVIGCSAISLDRVKIQRREWDIQTEATEISKFDIGIMPLNNDSFSKGKCGLKLIQYMACGVPSVASPVGANKSIIQNGVNGFLANTKEEWVEKIELLINNQNLRETIGKNAINTIIKKYSLQQTAPNLINIFEKTVKAQNSEFDFI